LTWPEIVTFSRRAVPREVGERCQLHLCVSWSEYRDVTASCNDVPTALTGPPTARWHTPRPPAHFRVCVMAPSPDTSGTTAYRRPQIRRQPSSSPQTANSQIIFLIRQHIRPSVIPSFRPFFCHFFLPSVLPFVCLSVTLHQRLTVCRVVMKFGKGALYKKLSNWGRLSANVLSDGYTALWAYGPCLPHHACMHGMF